MVDALLISATNGRPAMMPAALVHMISPVSLGTKKFVPLLPFCRKADVAIGGSGYGRTSSYFTSQRNCPGTYRLTALKKTWPASN